MINRIQRLKRYGARDMWSPRTIHLGWLTYDLLLVDLHHRMPYTYHTGDPNRGYLLGFEVFRDDSFPIGGIVTMERDAVVRPWGADVEVMTLPLDYEVPVSSGR